MFGTKAYAKKGKLVCRLELGYAVWKTRVLWCRPIVNLAYDGLATCNSIVPLFFYFNKEITYREKHPSFEVPHQERGQMS